MSGAFASPLLISRDGSKSLERVPLTGTSGVGAYDEKWLQELLYEHPESLPIAEIDPTFNGLIPICREMSTPAGPVDVLYATASGRIAVLEAKLWRNPEARRKVIGQILDYAKELSHWTYETLDAAVRGARRRALGTAQGLYEVVRGQHGELDEAQFIDAVSRNLRRGEMLLLIVGDGIRENVGAITHFIEDHGTLQFTFGLVEMAVFQMPNGDRLVHPRVLAHSEVIQRVVVELRDGALVDAGEEIEEGGDAQVSRPDLEEQRRQYQDFWTEFLKKYPLDDQGQPVKSPTIGTNQFYDMPSGSKGRIAAVAAFRSGSAGVYLQFPREPSCDRIYERLRADSEAIHASVSDNLKWDCNDKFQWVAVWQKFGEGMLTEHRAEVQEWLGNLLNRFINEFRPRIVSLLRDE